MAPVQPGQNQGIDEKPTTGGPHDCTDAKAATYTVYTVKTNEFMIFESKSYSLHIAHNTPWSALVKEQR